MTAEEATDPARWASQIRATVKFSGELDTVLADPHRILVEVGPGGSLTASAARQPRWSNQHRAVRLMRHQLQNRDDRDAFLLALGQLWSAGVNRRLDPPARPPSRPDVSGCPAIRLRGKGIGSIPKIRADRPDGPIPFRRRPHRRRPPTAAAGDGGTRRTRQQQIEATLQRIWAESLGIESIDRNADFFELGGDSVSAIGIATNLAKEGLDLSPQDLFDHHTIAGSGRHARPPDTGAGSADCPRADVENPPVPPNITRFLEHGLREAGRWCVPLILRLGPEVSVDDVRAVLTAVTNHHDALRLQIVERAGTWEQHIARASRSSPTCPLALPTM